MSGFLIPHSLSEITEASDVGSVIIFKYSNSCESSTRLAQELEQAIDNKKIMMPVYQVTVQTQPVLSNRIAYVFDVKHESPQILIIKKNELVYTAHHEDIDITKFPT